MTVSHSDETARNMHQKTTEELLAILVNNDQQQWSDAAFNGVLQRLKPSLYAPTGCSAKLFVCEKSQGAGRMGHAGENVFPDTENDSDSGVDLQHKFQNRSRVGGNMRRLAAVIALMLLPTIAVGQDFSIKGHSLKETTAQFLAVEGHTYKHLDKIGDGWIYGRKHSDLTGEFKNGSLVKLDIHLEPRSYEASKLAMTQRMGVPAVEREFPMFNRYGAKWSNYGARWDAVSACATLVIDNSPNNNQPPFLVVEVKSECDADNAKASTNPLD